MNIDEKNIKLERQRVAAEIRLKRVELKIQKQQFETGKKGPWAWVQTPIGAGIIVALVGLFGTVYNGYQSNLIEKSKQESSLILEAIKTGGKGEEKEKETAANLILLIDAGLIGLPKGNIERLREIAGNSLPSLPPAKSNIDNIPTPSLTSDLLSRVATSESPGTKSQISIEGVGNDESSRYDFVQKYLQSLNYIFDTADNHVNIVGFRQLDNPDKYDDVILLVWTKSGVKNVKEFRASCDPGRELTINPQHNPKGVANLMDGQSEFVLGLTKGYKALRPVGEQTIWRDKNRNFTFDAGDPVETGLVLLLIQAGGIAPEVGYGSGSQLIFGGKDGEQYRSFIELLETFAQSQERYRYSLITVPKGQPTGR